MALVLRGGKVSTINRKLRRHGQPRLKTRIKQLPRSGRIAIVWNPQGAGSPNVKGNEPHAYWPGGSYVDWVANDLYEINGRAYWKGMDPLYRRYNKPFMIAEWAPWGYDGPDFVREMFRWVKSHPRTKAVVYYGNAPRFNLSRKPRSRKAYRGAVRDRRFICPVCASPTG